MQKILSSLNFLGFCFLPKITSTSMSFVNAYHAQHGFKKEDYNRVCSPEGHQDKIYPRSETPKIPYKTHRIWITDPYTPQEMKKIFNDPFLIEQHEKTNRIFEASTPGEKWEHYLWTNDKKLIPETVLIFESKGIIVREFNDLSLYTNDF